MKPAPPRAKDQREHYDWCADVNHEGDCMASTEELDSAAADMARVLLAIEWSCDDGQTGRCLCPACAGAKPGREWGPYPSGHRDGCALDAALRKAGVR